MCFFPLNYSVFFPINFLCLHYANMCSPNNVVLSGEVQFSVLPPNALTEWLTLLYICLFIIFLKYGWVHYSGTYPRTTLLFLVKYRLHCYFLMCYRNVTFFFSERLFENTEWLRYSEIFNGYFLLIDTVCFHCASLCSNIVLLYYKGLCVPFFLQCVCWTSLSIVFLCCSYPENTLVETSFRFANFG